MSINTAVKSFTIKKTIFSTTYKYKPERRFIMIGLIEALQENDKSTRNLFVPSTMSMGYPTRLAPMLDYMLGYNVHVYDGSEYVETYPSLGVKDGSIVEIVGKSSTAKTTMAIQIASNIVRKYEQGVVIHYDIERAMNYTRIASLSRFTMPQISSGKYILRREYTTIQDIKITIANFIIFYIRGNLI